MSIALFRLRPRFVGTTVSLVRGLRWYGRFVGAAPPSGSGAREPSTSDVGGELEQITIPVRPPDDLD